MCLIVGVYTQLQLLVRSLKHLMLNKKFQSKNVKYVIEFLIFDINLMAEIYMAYQFRQLKHKRKQES